MTLTNDLIMEKAQMLATNHPHLVDDKSVQFTKGWANRFRERYDIKFVKLHGEAASAPASEVEAARDLIKDLVQRYHPSLIYNMDEAGLFWQMEPDKSLVTSEEGDVRGVKK